MLWDVMVPLYIKDGKDWDYKGEPFDVYRVRWSIRAQVEAPTASAALAAAKKVPGKLMIAPVVQRTRLDVKVAA